MVPVTPAPDRLRSARRRRAVAVIVLCAAVVLGTWLWQRLSAGRAVYVVGDSITSLSRDSISAALGNAGYQPTIGATPGAKIGQAQAEITSLARNRPWAWIIELGTDDAGANDDTWPEPFLAEWRLVSTASCVVYVTISPRAGPVGTQINAAIERLARAHANVHVLDWGTAEYTNPAWVRSDTIHPTPQGQGALANFEAQELQQACRSH